MGAMHRCRHATAYRILDMSLIMYMATVKLRYSGNCCFGFSLGAATALLTEAAYPGAFERALIALSPPPTISLPPSLPIRHFLGHFRLRAPHLHSRTASASSRQVPAMGNTDIVISVGIYGIKKCTGVS